MTDLIPRPAPAPRAPVALFLGLGSLILMLAVGGAYFWEQQSSHREQNNAMIDQLRRIDAHLSKLEDAASVQDTRDIGEKLARLDARLTDFARATDAVVSQSNDVKALTEKLQMVLTDQAKLHDEISALRLTNRDAHVATQQLAMKDQQAALLRELSDLAPALLVPPRAEAGKGNFWDSAVQNLHGLVTARPLPSANADIATPAGRISRALYDLERGNVQSALDILPKAEALAEFRAHAAAYLAAQQSLVKMQSSPDAAALPSSSSNPLPAQQPDLLSLQPPVAAGNRP